MKTPDGITFYEEKKRQFSTEGTNLLINMLDKTMWIVYPLLPKKGEEFMHVNRISPIAFIFAGWWWRTCVRKGDVRA